MSKLAGKVAIITGATSGIGRSAAERFVEAGAKVVVCGRRNSLGKQLEQELGHENCHFVQTDVTIEAHVKALVAEAVAQWGRIDCLFNNAGSSIAQGGIETTDIEDFDRIIAVVLRSAVLCMKHVAPIMMAQKSGSIINNGSIAGQRAGYSSHSYSAAKAGVIHLTRNVAMQLGEHNIRVNSISPGAIGTGIFGKAAGLPPDQADSTAEAVSALFSKSQPIPRAGLPVDIANAAVFLASDDSAFVNGHDLVVDGGIIGGRLWSAFQQGRQTMAGAFRTKG